MSPLLGAFEFRNPEQIIGPAICHIAIHIVHAFFALRIWDESLCYKIVQTFAESLPAAVIQRHAHPATGVIRLGQVVGRLVSYPPAVRHLVIVKATSREVFTCGCLKRNLILLAALWCLGNFDS